ncbi:MAG: endonuclease/exonuclease/phosphatase family protein [Kiritimatiellae bacterium]|nr:endonuclease/exonuclease/phosphatase family protein [Kiritimatiellia bacterium]
MKTPTKRATRRLAASLAIATALAAAQTAQARSLLYYHDFDTIENDALVYTGVNKGTGATEFTLKVNGSGAPGFVTDGVFGSDGAFCSTSGTSLWLGGDSTSLGCGTQRGFTISFWLKTSASHGSWTDFFGFRVQGYDYRCEYNTGNSGSFMMFCAPSGNDTNATLNDSGAITQTTAGEWKHVAFVFMPNGTDNKGTCSIYVGGERVAGMTIFNAGDLQQLHIGSWVRKNGNDRQTNANSTGIDELAVFDYPATAEQVKWLAKFKPAQIADAPGRAMPLAWHFHESDGTAGILAKNSGVGTDEADKWKNSSYYNWVNESTGPAALSTIKAFHPNNNGTYKVEFAETGSVIPTLGSGLTLSCWVRPPDSTTQWSDFMTFQIGNRYERFELNVANGSSFQVYGTTVGSGAFPMTANDWNHVCMVYNEDTHRLEFYHGGVKTSNYVDLSGASATETLKKFLAGSVSYEGTGSERHTSGYTNSGLYLDEIAIFNHSLSPDQIAWLASNIPCLPPLDATNLVRTVSANGTWAGGLASWGVKDTTRTTIYPSLEDTEVEVSVTIADGVTLVNDTFVTPKSLALVPATANAAATITASSGAFFAPQSLEIGDGLSLTVPLYAVNVGGTLTLDEGSIITFDVSNFNGGETALAAGAFALPEGETEADILSHFAVTAAEGFTLSLAADGKSIVVESLGPQNYTWIGAGGDEWSADGNWNDGTGPVTWTVGKTAIFETPGASATLASAETAREVIFRADATVGGAAELTVSSVVVSNGVSAAINAPIASEFVKSGPGTLALGANRSVATTLAEGTLEMADTTSLDWGTFVFGTAPKRPVALVFDADATLASIPAPWQIGTVAGITNTVVKEGGAWNVPGVFELGAVAGNVATFTHNGGTMAVAGDFNVGHGGAGTLTVNDGTVEVANNKWVVANSSGVGTINLSGGIFKTQHLHEESGSTLTLVFNGGTLFALRQDNYTSGNGYGLIGANIDATADAGGGTIDANGQDNALINSEIGGTGGMSYKGGGVVTFTVQPTYAGNTVIEVGTTVVLPSALAGDKLTFTIPTGLAAGLYKVAAVSGDGAFAAGVLSSATLPDDANAHFFLLDGGKEIWCAYGNSGSPVWIGGTSSSLSDSANWWPAGVPQSGDSCFIGSATAATLAVGDTFAPSSVTFAADSAAVTISGERTLSGIAAVTNLSAFLQEIACPLAFADTYRIHCTSEPVNFSGGATATFPDAANTDNAATHTLMGEIHFTANWSANNYSLDNAYRVPSGSWLYGKSMWGNQSKTTLAVDAGGYAEFGSVFTGANCALISVQGEMKVNGTWVVQGYDAGYVGVAGDANLNGVIRANGVWKGDESHNMNREVYVKIPNLYIGSDGLGAKKEAYAIHFDTGKTTVYATDDFEIFGPVRSGEERDWCLSIDAKTTFDTQNHTITWTGGAQGSGELVKAGAGTLVFSPHGTALSGTVTVNGGTLVCAKSIGMGSGAITVNSGATLAIANNCSTGTGAVTVGNGGALVAAESGSASVGGNLTLEDGATLKFNFTDRKTASVLNLTGQNVTLGTEKSVKVSLSGTCPAAGADSKYGLAATALSASAAATSTFDVRAGSYNIRCITDTDTGDRAWSSRKGNLVSLVKKISFDVVGFQEVKENQKTYLNSNLSGYTLFAGTISGSSEYLPVAYKSSRFERLGGGTFWLSDTPNSQSKFSASQHYRICTWVLLRDKTTLGRILFANTHLDLVESVRAKQMRVVMNFLKSYIADGVYAVVVGDMNCHETESTIVEATGTLRDAAIEAGAVSGPWRTYNAWTYVDPATEPTTEYALTLPVAGRNPLSGGKRIDFVLVPESAQVNSYVVCNDTQPDKEIYPSDHYPVYADLTLHVRNLVPKGRFTVEVTAECPSVAGQRRFVLTNGAGLTSIEDVNFNLPKWVERAAVEYGEIVIYTKPHPLSIRVR